MKKILLSSLLTIMSSMLMAQTLQENEAVLVYYMPKTELVMHLQYDVTTQTPGIFYQYAKRFLGAEDIITKASTQYTLNSINITTKTSADLDRAHQVLPVRGIQTQLLSLTEDGRLLGYNITPQEPKQIDTFQPTTCTAKPAPSILPLLEEQFIAGTTAKMAEGAAKQIYRIREMRLNLLVGEVEHVPADGQAMQLVLDELNKREAELVALFIGTTTVSSHTSTITYVPQGNKKQEVICRFSLHNGLVKSNDLSGAPIYLNATNTKPSLQEAEMIVNSKTPTLSPIYYNLPAHTKISLEYNGQTMCEGTYIVPQHGVDVPLSYNLFTSKPAPSIYFNPNTGNIQSIK